MVDLIDTKEKEKNKGGEVTNSIADDEYPIDPTDSMDDYLMDSIDEEEIMLNKEWVQALIDLDEAGYNKQ